MAAKHAVGLSGLDTRGEEHIYSILTIIYLICLNKCMQTYYTFCLHIYIVPSVKWADV